MAFEHYLKQECIPVGCVPPALVAVTGCVWGVYAPLSSHFLSSHPLPLHPLSKCMMWYTPLGRQTPVKTLPSRNIVCDLSRNCPFERINSLYVMNWPRGDALSFSYRFHHWLMVYTLGQYIVNVQSSTTSDEFSTIFIQVGHG